MSDDDGLLLNFSTPSVPKVQAPADNTRITGGTWRERLKAKRAIKGITPGSQANATKAEDRPPRRQKAEQTDEQKFQDLMKPKADPRFKGRPPKSAAGKNRKEVSSSDKPKPVPKIKPQFDADGDTFVSSIFSAGDKDGQVEDNEPHAPGDATNAPLTDSSTFQGLGLDPRLASALNKSLHLSTPTSIQRSVIPRLTRNDQDLFVQAQTGSGKTLSYVLPIIQRLMACPEPLDRQSGLFAIILAPTRELTNQIHSVLETVCRSACHWLVPGIVIGGEKKKSEKARIRKGVNILVATPGRLADHFDNTSALDLSNIRWLVFDEGDRLMELGFEETITKILNQITNQTNFKNIRGLPHKQVNVICSATMKSTAKKLGEMSLTDAEWVTPDDDLPVDDHFAPDQLVQQSAIIPAKLRLISLAAKLITFCEDKKEAKRIMVFLSCSDSVEFHFALFGRRDEDSTDDYEDSDDDDDKKASNTIKKANMLNGANIYKLHGSLSQQARTSTLAAFKNDVKTSIMFCTDVASRGLDLPEISDVVEYDPPFNKEDHLHRIGRTARAGKSGSSILFLLPSESEYLEIVKPLHHQGIQQITSQQLLQAAFGEAWETDATTWHLNAERWLLQNSSAMSLAKRGFTSHVRAYATHISSEKEIFSIKSLHLGHIAKSFGLRDPPGQSSISASKKRKMTLNGTSSDPNVNKKRMLQIARSMDQKSEFNIGY